MPECPLCERTVETLTRHHLEPKRRKQSDVVEICGPCHDQIHAVFTHHELRQRYDSLEALRTSDEMGGSSTGSATTTLTTSRPTPARTFGDGATEARPAPGPD